MKIIKIQANDSGSHPAPYPWTGQKPPDGRAFFPAEFEAEFETYNGFVFLTIDGDTVTAMTPNIEAWEAWKASLPPEPEPEGDPLEAVKADVADLGAAFDALLEVL